MKTLEFDFLLNPIPQQERMLAITDSFFKAYVFLNEELLKAKIAREQGAISYLGSDPNKVTVVDLTIELTSDEAKFVYEALRAHYKRIY